MDNASWVKTEEEITRMIGEYKLLVFKACKRVRLPRCDWEAVLNNVAIAFAKGKLDNYNPARGVSYSSYVYAVARNCALDEIERMNKIA